MYARYLENERVREREGGEEERRRRGKKNN
jgi:hypothetical protein